MVEERQLADQLHSMSQTALADPRIDDADLIPILRFIGQIVLVVEQAFDQLLGTLIELRHIKPDDLLEPRKTELLSSLDELMARSRYRDVEEICSRLHHLSEKYQQTIRPKLGSLADEAQWSQVFRLLDEYEGWIIEMVQSRIYSLRAEVAHAKTTDLPSIRQRATGMADELRQVLDKLWTLRNKILGLSGTVGFLELLETGQRNQAIAASARGDK